MGALRKLRLRFIWRRPVTWSLRHSVAGTQRRKQTALKHETYLTRKTQPGTNWRVFWQSITLLSSSSKTPGKATGSVSDWTHVRSLARRKSMWTIGGCGALRRCGCARTYEGTRFLCVKFRLGSAGEPTICSHCYDVLNEVEGFGVPYIRDLAVLTLSRCPDVIASDWRSLPARSTRLILLVRECSWSSPSKVSVCSRE